MLNIQRNSLSLTDHCCPTSECGFGTVEEVIDGHLSHERKLHMSVGINSTGDHHSSRRIQHLSDVVTRYWRSYLTGSAALRLWNAACDGNNDLHNDAILDEHVGNEHGILVDDCAILDEQRHCD